MIYSWSIPKTDLSAQIAGERMESIRKRNQGRLTAALLLEDAQARKSPLHKLFEWDDEKAAHSYRLQQASDIIRNIYVVYEGAENVGQVRAFVNITEPKQERAYVSMNDALQNPEFRRQILERALQEVTDWRRRYAAYNELAAIFSVIDKAA